MAKPTGAGVSPWGWSFSLGSHCSIKQANREPTLRNNRQVQALHRQRMCSAAKEWGLLAQ